MKHIDWDDAFSIGVRVIDDQHRTLFTLRNDLADCCRAPEAIHSERFHDILSEMFEYSRTHFATEEAYMRSIGYPELDRHVEEHAGFIESVADLSVAIMAGRATPEAVLAFLSDWLLAHILKSDRRICDPMREPAVALDCG
ncbi:bacteriohemerythrin [Niveibacterium sp.]|uniref:bacteriohemerythrin n=1 Tax=Niveibacterium sp. TaxID=2017444 RepID=UPI0035AFEA4A